MKITLVIFIVISFLLPNFYSQTATHFSQQEFNKESSLSSLVRIGNGQLILFWYNKDDKNIYMSRSFDEGITWSSRQVLNLNMTYTLSEMNTFLDSQQRIVLQVKVIDNQSIFGRTYYSYSSDNGNTWSNFLAINYAGFFNSLRGFYSSLGKLSNNILVFVHSYAINSQSQPKGIYFSKFENNNWTTYQLIDSTGIWGFLFSPSINKEMVVFADSNGNKTDLYYRTSTDAGVTWSQKQLLLSSQYSKSRPRVAKVGNDIYIYYEENIPTYFNNIQQKEIFYIKSSNNGQSWSSTVRVTRYSGDDNNLNICSEGGILIRYQEFRNYTTRQVTRVYKAELLNHKLN